MSEQVQIRPRDSQRFLAATWVSEGRGCVRLAAFLPVASACAADSPARRTSARFSTIGAGARLQTKVSGLRVGCSIGRDSMCLPLSVSTETHVGHSAGGSLKLICDSTYSIVIRRHSRVAEGGACGRGWLIRHLRHSLVFICALLAAQWLS